MLEWYRAGEPYERLMEDCAALLGLAAELRGPRFVHGAACRAIHAQRRSA